MTRSWLRIAHRGASGHVPEHTRPAFTGAVLAGVDMIELDVQLSRDHELVVIHDFDLERTTNGFGAVREHDLTQLKTLDAGKWFGPQFAGEPVLTLSEVIELIAGRARLNVEIKAPAEDWPILTQRLISTLRTHEQMESTIISCFEPEALLAVRRRAADARLGVLWQRTDYEDAWRWAQELAATSFHPYWMLASPEVVAAAHQRGLQVVVWTVNDIDAMTRLLDSGVDGIISDFPERFANVPAP